MSQTCIFENNSYCVCLYYVARGHLHGHFILWRLHGPMFLSRHAENVDDLPILQCHIDTMCTGMLAKVVSLSRKQQVNTCFGNKNDMYMPSDIQSVEHIAKCSQNPQLNDLPDTTPLDTSSAIAEENNSTMGDEGIAESSKNAQLHNDVDTTLTVPSHASVVEDNSIVGDEEHPCACPYPEQPQEYENMASFADNVASAYQLHKCVRRCRSGRQGQVQCSARFCRNLSEMTTISQWEEDTTLVKDSRDNTTHVCRLECIEKMPDIRPAANMPVGDADTRCICIDIKRPRVQDGFTAEYNKTLMGCVHCNNCWMVFAGGQEAKNVCNFIVHIFCFHYAYNVFRCYINALL